MVVLEDRPRDYRLAATWFVGPTMALGLYSWLAYEYGLLGLISLAAGGVGAVWGLAGILYVVTRRALSARARFALAALCLAGVGLGLGRAYFLARLLQFLSPGT